MSNGGVNVPAEEYDKDNQSNPTPEPNPVNVTMGGVPQQWTASNPISGFDLKRDSGIDRILGFEEFHANIGSFDDDEEINNKNS